ncbi:hypothetical protein A247_01180, partial [Pseudomonas syringae pv. actinidiae ICMP 19099]
LQRCNQRASIDDFTEHLFLRQYTNDIIRMLCQAFQAVIHGLHHHFHVLGRLTIAKLMIDSPIKRRCVHAQSEVLVVIKVTKLWIFILTLQ